MPTRRPDRTRRRLTTGLAALIVGRSVAVTAGPAATFPLFDGLGHRGKPAMRRLGLKPLQWVGNIWHSGARHAEVDEAAVTQALNQLPPDTESYYLDIEDWPVLRQQPAVRAASISKLLRVADLARRLRPQAKFGFYGLPPAITYWPLVTDSPADYADWVQSNQLLGPLAERVDYIFPSLYTFYRDRKGWLTYADATLRAARQYGKPVYPFLWFNYHDSNRLLRDREIDPEAWTEELRFCRDHADGLVLWGGYQQGWSESAPWWQAVRKDFGLAA